MAVLTLISPDRLSRVALLAVELVDPVTLARVSQGITVIAEGLANLPIISLSSRFAWFAEGDQWPTRFSIDPGRLPYEREEIVAPARPPKPDDPKPEETRVFRIILRPTVAYPFTEGVTVVRGQLQETADKKSAMVKDAEIWIRWLSFSTDGTKEQWLDAPIRARTNQSGEFAALLRLPTNATPYEKDGNRVKNSNLKARIAVARDGLVCEMADQLTIWKIYELPEGRLYDLPEALAYSALTPVNNS
jgi:hypothetical protein